MINLIKKYSRFLPHKFCPGCGNGIILNCFMRAIDQLDIDPNSYLCVSGIGCSSWIPSPYLNLDTFHTVHGRAIAYATGAKVANKKLNVIVFTGDGDGAGIGGNHLIHAARRNIDLTVFLINNYIYGMTGGQMAPTTPKNSITSTSVFGSPERPFDLCDLVKSAGATYIARWSVFQPRQLIKSMKEAILHKGFAFIEILSPCPTEFGRRNQLSIKDYLSLFDPKSSREKNKFKKPLGIFVKKKSPEFCDILDQIKKIASKKGDI